jgi:hypothetical protein
MDKEIRKPTVHSMKRRSHSHDYRRCGYYHITISVAKALRQPLGRIAGRLDKPDGDCDAPHVELSAIGQMVEEELECSIHQNYPMLEVIEHIVMPEHLHFLLVVHKEIVSQQGRPRPLGNVIAGFKYGCNMRYWTMTGMINPEEAAGNDLTTESSGTRHPAKAGTVESVLGDSVAKKKLPPLFDAGYCDVMPIDEGQFAIQLAYIRANPRSRLMRTINRLWLQPHRHTVNTAVCIPALRGYLQRECPQQLTTDGFALLTQRLLLDGGLITCDSYGNALLLRGRLLPVVCHRRDEGLFEQQKARCLEESLSGAVLVSARIAKGEQEILDTALHSGHPVIRVEDNGFPDIYHPSADRMDDCASGLLLLLTPWSYKFRTHDEGIKVPFCKTMNCVVQALCRTKDNWWKNV